MSYPELKCHVFVDFDGTIAVEDTTDILLERFALPEWRAIEQEWNEGLIGSRECLVRQIDLVRARPEEIDAFISTIKIDPGFAGFASLCSKQGHDITVISDGLDRTIRKVLSRENLALDFFANAFESCGEDRWRLDFPYSRGDCPTLAGNCKCQFTDSERQLPRIMIGDGRSDFCVAARVDLVLAKGQLALHCAEVGIQHIVFEDFEEASHHLLGWLAEQHMSSEYRTMNAERLRGG